MTNELRRLEEYGMQIKERIWNGAENKEELEKQFEEVRQQVLELRAKLNK